MKKNSRVVITGMGIILPGVDTVEHFWEKLYNGESQIDYLTRFSTENFPVKTAAEIKSFEYKNYIPGLISEHAKHYNRETLAIMSAMELARKDAGLQKDSIEPHRVGFVDSSSRSGLEWWFEAYQRYVKNPSDSDIFNRYAVLTSMSSNPSTLTAINNNIQGFVTTVSSACVGGHHAIALCYQAIRKNRAVVMYAGGHEFPLVKPLMAMYSDPKSSVMSKESDNPKRAIKPYDERRDGFILGEGAMVLCMENYDHAVKRGARIYAEVLGTLSYNEASHAMRMDISGRKGAVGLNKLLEITKIARDDLGYICGHGTATYNNDLAESRTYKLLFEFLPEKDRPLMGSIKPIFGHTFGAAGIINVGATALMLQNKSVCPTINHEIRDKEAIHDCVPGKGRKVHIKKAVSMAYAIGSQSSFVALSEAS